MKLRTKHISMIAMMIERRSRRHEKGSCGKVIS